MQGYIMHIRKLLTHYQICGFTLQLSIVCWSILPTVPEVVKSCIQLCFTEQKDTSLSERYFYFILQVSQVDYLRNPPEVTL